MNAPLWLGKEGKWFWDRHYKKLNLAPQHEVGFALLCQVYGKYFLADTEREQAQHLDSFIKLGKLYGVLPAADMHKAERQAKQFKADVSEQESFEQFLEEGKTIGMKPDGTPPTEAEIQEQIEDYCRVNGVGHHNPRWNQ